MKTNIVEHSASEGASDVARKVEGARESMPVSSVLAGVKVAMVTMGCAKNEVDSARMRGLLRSAGATIVDDGAASDLVIVNTCSFIQSATEESIEAVFDAIGLSESVGADIPVIVSGCMPARYGNDLEDSLAEVAAFVPCSKEDDIVRIASDALAARSLKDGRASQIYASAPVMDTELDPVCDSRSFAYVKISDGCDRWCSYCTIPMIRGRYHSFTLDEIDANVSSHVESGKKEIVLIAQDTGRWGDDLDGDLSLAWLMATLAEKYQSTWFRVMYVQPEGITDELLEVMAAHDNICSYLDIPLQHVDTEILKAMNRTGDKDAFIALIDRIKQKLPDAHLRTTFIAGFPGESEENFDSLKSFVEEGLFDYVGVFPYSREEGTRAAKLDGQIDDEEKLFRAARITEIADAVSASKIATRIGSSCKVLVEGAEEDGQLFGRCASQAPDVDGITFIDGGEIGNFVDATIIDTLFYDMEAEV